MSSANNPNNDGNPSGGDSPDPQIGLHVTSEEVDDALTTLNFDLDFDQIAESMGGALPDINLDDMGSLGTRSPSPSHASTSGSVFSKGSKRSRAEFDSESECNSDRNESKRMVFQTGTGLELQTASGLELNMDQLQQQQQQKQQQQQQQQQQKQKEQQQQQQHLERNNSSAKMIRQDREREGRCPDCGLDTHRIATSENGGYELHPLTIEGEVLKGRCLLCNPLKEGEVADKNFSVGKQPSKKKGGRARSGERSSSKKRGGRKKNSESKDSEPTSSGRSKTPHPPPRANSSAGPGHAKMSPSHPSQQQRQMMRSSKISPQLSGKPLSPNHPLPFPPPGRDSRRSSSGSHSNSKFSTPTPSQYHSKMALLMQSKLPRKHSPMQQARMVFGNTNNRRSRPKGAGRRSSGGSGVGNQQMGGNQIGGQMGSNNNMGSGNKPGPPGDSGGSGIFHRPQHSSSNASLSSVSCSEIESTPHNHDNADDRSNYSKGSHFSQSSLGRLGKAMDMGMGMSCAETVSDDRQFDMSRQQQQQRPRSSDPPSQPQTPHQNRRAPSDPPLSRSGSSMLQTPQSVPANMSSMQSNRMMIQSPQSVPPNMSNSMPSRMGGGGGGGNQQRSSQLDLPNMSNTMHNDNITGNVPPAIRLAHSKLSSSIYHHHLYPMPEDMERAHVEKTLAYLDAGSGDIGDIIVAMRRFPFSLAIQRVSADKLYAHCFDAEHAHAIGLVGGIRTIIDAMEHHPEDATLQRGCAGVIKHLASASTYNLEMLDRMGAVGIIVGAMDRHPKCAPLLESCCWAMESMSRSSSQEIKMRVAKGGGIHAAMKAVEVFPNNESLLRAAFHCLRQLGYNPSDYGGRSDGRGGGGQGQGGQGGQGHFQLPKQHAQKLQQFHHQQQQQGRHGSDSRHHQREQKQQQHVSHRGSSGSLHRSGGGMNMMPSNMMMGNNMGGNNAGMNSHMMGNMMGNNSMMGMNNMGNNMNMGNDRGMNMNMGGMNMGNNNHNNRRM